MMRNWRASKETAMQLFNCSENDEAEVTNVDKENHDVEELVLTNVQSTGNCLSKTNGGMFQDMVRKMQYSQCQRGRRRQCKPLNYSHQHMHSQCCICRQIQCHPSPTYSAQITPYRQIWPSLTDSWRTKNHE